MEQNINTTRGNGKGLSSVETKQNMRQRIPLKMFGKQFSSKRLLVSSKVWMHTIPTRDCDIVLMLPASTLDATLMWLLARLRSRTPQLLVHVRHHSNSGIYGLYMTARYESLLRGAEELGIRKPVRSEYGGGIKEFVFEDQDCFQGILDEEVFLSSQERQSIVYHMLNNLRATEGEEVQTVKFLQGQPIVPMLVSRNVVSGVFPLHCAQDLLHLRKSWVQAFLQKQPLDDICDYFGIKIGLYFAYLGHYTAWLLLPSLMGIIMWMLQCIDQWWEDVSWAVFGIFNIFWATVYLAHWKRTSATLAYRWGTFDKKDELLRDPRPLYKGDLQKSLVTGHMEPVYPAWKRNIFRYFVSLPIILLCLFFIFVVMLLIFQVEEWVKILVANGDVPGFCRFGPKVLLAVSITVLDDVYKQVANWLNNKENYRLKETHENNLVLKLVLVQFVSSFLSLFYIAFYLRDMDRLREQLAALLITRQVVGNIKEALLPYIMWKGRLYQVGYKIASKMSNSTLDREMEKVAQEYRRKLKQAKGWSTHTDKSTVASDEQKQDVDRDGTAGQDGQKGYKKGSDKEGEDEEDGDEAEGHLTQAEVESAMAVYDDTFSDHLEMSIQFGYVILFSSAFPLAAVCSLLNNIVEIRSDAFKLCYTHQRPFGVRVEDIGIWEDVLEAMVVIAVIVNAALVGMAGMVEHLVPSVSDIGILLLIVVLEHVILGIKFILDYSIPPVPQWVATEMAKVEFQRREALKHIESQCSTTGNPFDARERSPRIRSRESESPDPQPPGSADVTRSPNARFQEPEIPDRLPPRTLHITRSPAVRSGESDAPDHPLLRSPDSVVTPLSRLACSSSGTPLPSFQARSQSLVGHRPQNFTNTRPEDRLQSRNLPSCAPSGSLSSWRGASEGVSRSFPSSSHKDPSGSNRSSGSPPAGRTPERAFGLYKNFWEPDRQIYRRSTYSTNSCRTAVRPESIGRNAGAAHTLPTESLPASFPPRKVENASRTSTSPPRNSEPLLPESGNRHAKGSMRRNPEPLLVSCATGESSVDGTSSSRNIESGPHPQ